MNSNFARKSAKAWYFDYKKTSVYNKENEILEVLEEKLPVKPDKFFLMRGNSITLSDIYDSSATVNTRTVLNHYPMLRRGTEFFSMASVMIGTNMAMFEESLMDIFAEHKKGKLVAPRYPYNYTNKADIYYFYLYENIYKFRVIYRILEERQIYTAINAITDAIHRINRIESDYPSAEEVREFLNENLFADKGDTRSWKFIEFVKQEKKDL